MWVIIYLVAGSCRDFDHEEFRTDREALLLEMPLPNVMTIVV